MLKVSFSAAIFLSIVACNPKSTPSATDIRPASVSEGMLARHGDTYYYTPCSEPKKRYKLTGLISSLEGPYEQAIEQGYEGQSTVASLRARPEDKGTMFVEKVIKVQQKNAFNTCIPYEFWGLGNEPFWSLQISKAEGLVEFGQLGEKTLAFKYKKPSVLEDGKLVRYFLDEGNNRLKVDIKIEECFDTMAGNKFPASITLKLNGVTYTGCALTPEAI